MHFFPFSRRTAALTLASALALGAVGCAASEPSTSPDSDGNVPLVVLYAAIAYEPLFIAEQEGYFDEAGLDVEIRRGGPPQDNLAQAVGGSADIIAAAWDTMVTSTAQGMPVKVVGGNSVVSGTVDTSGVLVREDSGITQLGDLAGKTVAFDSIGAGGTVEFYTALDAAGVSRDEVTIVALPYASMAVSLENGQVDAVFPSEPFYSQVAAVDENAVIANPVRETRAGIPITLWAATTPWLDEHPDEAASFLDAMEKGIAFYEDPANLEAVKKIRAEVTEVSIDEVPDALPAMRLALDPEAGSKAIEQLERFDMVTKPLTVEEIIWSDAPHV